MRLYDLFDILFFFTLNFDQFSKERILLTGISNVKNFNWNYKNKKII